MEGPVCHMLETTSIAFQSGLALVICCIAENNVPLLLLLLLLLSSKSSDAHEGTIVLCWMAMLIFSSTLHQESQEFKRRGMGDTATPALLKMT